MGLEGNAHQAESSVSVAAHNPCIHGLLAVQYFSLHLVLEQAVPSWVDFSENADQGLSMWQRANLLGRS